MDLLLRMTNPILKAKSCRNGVARAGKQQTILCPSFSHKRVRTKHNFTFSSIIFLDGRIRHSSLFNISWEKITEIKSRFQIFWDVMQCSLVVLSVRMKFLELITQLHIFIDQRPDSLGKTYGNIKY